MLATLRQRNFALLWFGGLLSITGSNVLFVALPFYVYRLTGSALATGAMFMAQTVPSVLIGSLAGVYVDRWNRKKTMVVANVSSALLLLLLLTVRSVESVWVVYVVAFFLSAISQFFGPAENALLPRLVGEEYLVPANALNALNNNIGMLIGPSIGGMLMGFLGLPSAIICDSVLQLVAGVIISRISYTAAVPVGDDAERPAAKESLAKAWTALWRDWVEGLRLVKGHRVVTAVFVAVALVMLGEGIFNVLLIPFIQVLHGGAVALGWLLTVRGLGGLIGGFVIGRVGNILKLKRLFPLSLLVLGLFGLAIFNLQTLWLAMGILFLWGVPAMGAQVSSYTLLQNNVPHNYQGRIFGAMGTTAALLALCGQGLASALGDRLGIVPLLNVNAVLYLLAGGIVWLMLGLHFRTVGQPESPLIAERQP
jgi:MFS family permease